MVHVRLTVGYDGTEFHGSQIQLGVRTVQEELERAIEQIGCGPSRLAFAGRTDRGVHALGQVASGQLRWTGSMDTLQYALNGVSPADVVVRDAAIAADEFHARFSARWREYRYRIVESAVPPVLVRRYVWWSRQRLDEELARMSCRRFIGRHAFGSFASSGKSRSLPVADLRRTVYHCSWTTFSGHAVTEPGVERLHELRIVADGFLPQMVRNIVSAVVAVARGDQPPEWIDFLLSAGDRSMLGKAAPSQGLYLWAVGYDAYDRNERNRPVEAGV